MISFQDTIGISTVFNGAAVQDLNTRDMICDLPILIEFLNDGTTLLPGTVVLNGTSCDAGMTVNPARRIKSADTSLIQVERMDGLTNSDIDEERAVCETLCDRR